MINANNDIILGYNPYTTYIYLFTTKPNDNSNLPLKTGNKHSPKWPPPPSAITTAENTTGPNSNSTSGSSWSWPRHVSAWVYSRGSSLCRLSLVLVFHGTLARSHCATDNFPLRNW